jgi:hypothetical protein
MKPGVVWAANLALCMSALLEPAWGAYYFPFPLESRQVVPPAQGVVGGGYASLMLICEEDLLRGGITIGIGETVTAVHIHGPAEAGQNGDLIFDFSSPTNIGVIVQLSGVAPYCRVLNSEACYVDVHTTIHPEGAIRGQFRREVPVAPEPWGLVKQLYR